VKGDGYGGTGGLLGRRSVTARPQWPLAEALAILEAAAVQRLSVADATGRLIAREALVSATRQQALPTGSQDPPGSITSH
jgi:hypothetical protein